MEDSKGRADPKSEGSADRPLGLGSGQRVILYDGVCELCASWSRFFIKRDPKKRVKLAALQSPEGQAILSYLGMDLTDFDTMVYLEDGAVHLRSSAALRAISQLPFPYSMARVALIVPPFIRNAAYKILANNRYRLFGKQDVCMLPSPEIRAHFLSAEDQAEKASVKG